MKKSVKAALAVTLSAVVLCAALGWWQFSQTDFQERQVHHELAQEADPSIGDAEIPEDFIVGDDFTSHLPLVVIDTAGQEIVNYKYYDAEIDAFVEPADVDPYTRMTVSVIDNGSHVNRLGDAPAVQSQRNPVGPFSSAQLSGYEYRRNGVSGNAGYALLRGCFKNRRRI